MANESSHRVSTSSSASSSSVDSYIGSFISLSSKYDIRYEGVLYHLNPQDSTLGLKNVKCYGTEGRKKDGPQIPPSDKVFEYILFRGSDIKDLQVKSSPPPLQEEPVPDDPAIIQSHSSVGPLSSSFQEPTALANMAYPGTGPLYQSQTVVDPGSPLLATQKANLASSASPLYMQGSRGLSLPATDQNRLRAAAIPPSTAVGLTYRTDVYNLPSVTNSNSVPLNITPPFAADLDSISSSIPSSLSANTSLPNHPSLPNSSRENLSLFLSSWQDMAAVKAPVTGKAASNSVASLSVQSEAHPRPPLLLSSMQIPHPDGRDVYALNSVSPMSTSIASPSVQETLLSLSSAQQPQHSLLPYTEEFDFEAMNEKFKKHEVWGYLGGAKQRVEAEGIEEKAAGLNLGHERAYGSVPKLEPKPAYSKDEFFDTLSNNSPAHAPGNVQNRFSERMKQDTQTFGSFQRRPQLGYDGARVENYRGSYNWRRGYNYSERGRGGNF